jgi:uncharacterized FlgJ-related protein
METEKATLEGLASRLKARLGYDKALLCMSQILHEVGGKLSPLARVNNFSGIVYVKQRYAKDSGIKQPDGSYNYAKYDSVEDYINDYLRIVGKSVNAATSLEDFGRKLKAQRYYGADVVAYIKGMTNFYKTAKRMLA